MRATRLRYSIIISHNGEECYRNSFDRCRRRSLAAGTRTATYVADCTVTNTVGSETYVSPSTGNLNGRNIVAAKVTETTTVEPVGLDGWRRLVSETPLVRKEGDSNPRYGNPYVSLANWWFQPLTHPSGTVRSELL